VLTALLIGIIAGGIGALALLLTRRAGLKKRVARKQTKKQSADSRIYESSRS
jgi:hypothetical protein